MAAQPKTFDRRLHQIVKAHRKLSRGQKVVVDKSGLMHLKPARPIRVPIRGLILALVGFVLFKAWLIASLGGAEYTARLVELGQGTLSEKLGAAVMAPDPATLGLLDLFYRFF